MRRPVEYGQYTSVHFAETLALERIAASIGSIGDAYDNALAETTNGLYKTEAIRADSPFQNSPLKSIEDVEWVTLTWVDWYNERRLHSAIGMIPPAELEDNHYAEIKTTSQPVMSPA